MPQIVKSTTQAKKFPSKIDVCSGTGIPLTFIAPYRSNSFEDTINRKGLI
jgi:hypothetical protein